jgi:hypothetical protein
MELAAKQPQAGEGRVKAIARSCLGQDYGIQDTPARFLARAQRDPDFAKHPQAVLLNVLSQTLPSLDVLQPLLTQIPVGQRAEVFGKVGGAIFDGTFTYLDAADYATERVMTPVFTDLAAVDQAVRERVLTYAERYKASFDIYEQARQRGYDSEAKPLDQSLPNNIVEEARMYIRLTNALFPNPMTHPETAHIYREPTLLLLRELSDFAFDHRIPTEDMIDFAESLQGLDQETQVQLLTYWFIEAQHPRMGTSSSDSASSGRGSRSQSNSLQARLLHEGTRLASSLRDLPVTSRREILEPLSDPASVSLIQMQEMASRAGPELSSSPESGEVPPSRLTGANVSTMPPPAMARSMARDASTVPPPARGRDASDVSPVSQVPATQASPRFDRLTDPADRADLATALLARHEAGFLEMSEADQAACRQYIQGHRDGLPLEDDPAFLRLQGEYEYNVRGELVLDDGSTRPIRGDLAYDTGGHAGANWDSRTGIVQSVDGGTVTVQNRNGQTLRLSAGIQSLQQHPFKPGDPVVLSLMAGGGLRPGERLGQPFPGNFAYVNDAAGHPTNERSAVLGRAFYPAMEQDPGISRQHAEIRWRPTPTGGQLLIQDLGSGNGTALFSDGRWIPIARGDAHPLEFGQVFQLGNNSFYRLNPDYTLQAVVNPAAAPGSAARVIQGNFTQIGVSSTGVVEVEGNGAHYQLVGHFSEVQPRSGVQMGTIHRATSDPRNPDWVHLQVFATSDLQQTPGIVHLILNREGAQALGVPFTNPDRSEPVIDASRPLPNVAIRRLTQTDQHSAARSAGAIPGDVASQPALGSPQTAPQGMPRLRSQRGEKIPEAMQDDGSVVYLGHIALRSFSDGTWVLTDTRDPATVRPWPKKTTDGISGPTELQINGEAIRPGQPTVVAPGDRIHVGFNILQLSVDRPAAFDLELAAVPGSAEITGSVEAARNFRELRSALETSGLPSAGEAVRALEQAVRGETTVDHLPQAIQEKTRQLMETLAQELRTHLPPGYEPFLGSHSTLHEASPVEQAYHAARAALLFQQQLTQARSVDEVRAAVDGTSLNNPMGSSRHILLRELDQYQSGQLPLQHFPTALRQKLRDIGELEMHRRHLVESRAPSYPADAGQRAAVQGLDTEAAALYTWVRGLGGWTGKVKGSAKDYKPEELAELVYRVVERGMPLEHLTTERGVRGRVEAHMQQVVAAAQGLYPGEWERAGRHNYFTGESLSDRNNQPNLQAQYRFARMMLNQQSGRPIFGEPTETEQATVRSFVGLGLTNSTVRDYGEAQEVIREHFARFTPELQQALRMVDPETRALVIEAYFGASQHRQVDDPHVAFRLSQFLGRIGFYREVGMTLNLSGGTVQTNLSLGDTGSVSPESDGLYFVLHTHPEEYVGKKGGVMGATDRRGVARTMVLGAGEQSGDTRNVVFSRQDVRLSVRAAQNLAQQLSRVDSQNISLLYDAERRVFQTWVQNPHGLAKMEVQLDGAGKPQEVRIRYGVYPSEGLDQNHVRYAERLRALSGELGIPVTVEQVDAAQVEAGLPY